MELRLTLFEKMSSLRRARLQPDGHTVWDSLSQKVNAGKQDKLTENELKNRFESVGKTLKMEEIQKTLSVWKNCL